jgi:signal transduction histidine kinase/PAS domain-containing protein
VLCYWVRATTGVPHWLPARWRRPLTGYLLALLVAAVAGGMTVLLATLAPGFELHGILLLVGIVVVALTCGVGPSLLATGASLLLLAGVLLAAALSGRRDAVDWVYVVVVLVSEIGLSLLAGQSSWARRRAEALAGALHAAKASSDVERQRLRTLLEVLPVPIAMVDTQGRFLELTPANETIWGEQASWAHTLAEVPAYPARRPDTGQPIARDELPLVRALTSGESTLDQELEVEAVDGQRKILLNSAVPIRDDAGAIRGAVSAVEDITERTRLEEALRQAEREAAARARELEAVFEALTDGLLVYDAEGRILRSNTAARQLLGFATRPDFAALPWQERAVRYAPRDVQGHSIPPEGLALSRLLRGEVLSGAQTAEDLLQTPDGREVAFGMTGRPLRDAEGTIVGAVGIARDETERRRLERQVAEHAAQLEAIFESIADGIVVTDRRGRVRHMNQAGRTLLGLGSEQDPTGWTLPQLERLAGFTGYTPQGRPLAEGDNPIPRVLQGEVLTRQQSLEMIVRTRAGRETRFNTTGAPIRDARGQLLGAVLVARDVTEQRRLEQHTRDSLDALLAMAEALVQGHEQADQGADRGTQALRSGADPALAGATARLAELTRRVLDCRSVSIVAVDAQTEVLTPITVVGRSREDELRWWAGWGREGEEGEGRPCLHDVLPPSAVAALRAGETVLPEHVPGTFGCWQQLSQVCPSVLVPMRVGEALVGGLQVDGEERGAPEDADAAEQRKALVRAVARLGALVLERERLLRERTQAQATELALRETQAQMEAFLATAAHDLRTPVTAVVGYLDLAARQTERLAAAVRQASPDLAPRVDAVRARLDDAGEGTRRLTRLLTVLFDTAAMRAGRLELQRAPCDLLALARTQVEAVRVSAPERTIRLHTPAASGGPTPAIPVEADADRLGQVVTNYVTNALKYSPPDQPIDVSVTVSAHGGEARVARVARVAVRDRGPGIPAAERGRVWEPFHRAPGVEVQGTARGGAAGGSLGLGLHICKAIVEAHGGRVGVESTVGAGSTFWFTLPVTDGPFASLVAPSTGPLR